MINRQRVVMVAMGGLAGALVTLIIYLAVPVTPAWLLYLSGFLGGSTGAILYLYGLGDRASGSSQPRKAEAPVGLPWQVNKLFLFNTLHNVAALTVIDTEKARTVIEWLAAYLRTVNDLHAQPLTLLAQESRCSELLLSIEQARLGERLRIQKNIDADCLEISVPSLILQPVVEHAVLHGVELSQEPVEIALSAYQHNGRLILEVQDNANVAYDQNRQNQNLIDLGFPDLGALLRRHYRSQATLEVSHLQPFGTRVRFSFPLRRN